jgi:hypothetical protein
MSLNDKAIKIIRREELERLKDPSSFSTKTVRQTRREMLQTVTSWIEKQREKKELEWRGGF